MELIGEVMSYEVIGTSGGFGSDGEDGKRTVEVSGAEVGDCGLPQQPIEGDGSGLVTNGDFLRWRFSNSRQLPSGQIEQSTP